LTPFAAARAALVAVFEEREGLGVEELVAAPGHPAVMTFVDDPEDGEELAPAAAPFVHRVGVRRLVHEQALVERLDRIAVLPKLLQPASIEDGRRSRSSA